MAKSQRAQRKGGPSAPPRAPAPPEPPPARRWAGAWLLGPGRSLDDQKYPGERLGLPADGPRSVAGMGRRLLALLIDWLVCTAISLAIFRSQIWTLAIFAGETYLLTALAGITVGKRITGIRVARLDGRPVGFGWALLRTLLLLAVVPPLVTDRDLRGLHDRAANTIVLRSGNG